MARLVSVGCWVAGGLAVYGVTLWLQHLGWYPSC